MANPLALDGAPPVRRRPFASWPHFADDEIEAVSRVLRSGQVNYWTGEEGQAFEEEFAAFAGCRYGLALANGTVALELGLRALQVGPGDEVVVTSRTFIASASAAVMVGARPVCADVDPESQNVTADTIRAVLTPKTKALITVHLAGWPCDMDPILALAKEGGLAVLEDCTQAHGARYKGRPIGSMGDLAAFSFCQDKIMTTGGEGGLLTTNSQDWYEWAWAFKDHGKSYDAVHRREHEPGFRWLHESFGTNWRMTELQAAMGRVMLRKLPQWVEQRRRHAAILTAGLSELTALRVTVPSEDVYHSYYKYYVFVRPEKLKEGWDRDRIIQAIEAEGVPCYSGSCSEIYLEKAFPKEWRPAAPLTVAQELGETSLMFLVHPTLDEEDMRDMVDAVQKVCHEAQAD